MSLFGNLFKNDPLAKAISGKPVRRRRVSSSRKRTLTASERRVVNAVARRVKPRRRRRY